MGNLDSEEIIHSQLEKQEVNSCCCNFSIPFSMILYIGVTLKEREQVFRPFLFLRVPRVAHSGPLLSTTCPAVVRASTSGWLERSLWVWGVLPLLVCKHKNACLILVEKEKGEQNEEKERKEEKERENRTCPAFQGMLVRCEALFYFSLSRLICPVIKMFIRSLVINQWKPLSVVVDCCL